MSYILDALRRADAERERGAVPSLQSQQHAIAEDDAVAARPRPLIWVVAGLTVALLATLAWVFFGGTAAPPRAPIEGAVAPAPTAVSTLPTSPPSPARPEPIFGQGATPAAGPGTTATIDSPAPLPARSPPAPAPAPAPTPRIETKRTAKPSTGIASAPATATASGENRIYAVSELPEEIRRDLPKVVIGGSSYSGDAASRMVMINGQVFHEGDRLSPGLVLERIRLKSAVLAYKGWRYEVVF